MDEKLEILRKKIVLSTATSADLIEELKQLSRFEPDRVTIAVVILKICAVLRLLQGWQKLEDGEDETAFIIRELETAWKMLEAVAGFSSSQAPGPSAPFSGGRGAKWSGDPGRNGTQGTETRGNGIQRDRQPGRE